MNFSFQILLLVATTAVYTAAMTCNKMIWDESSNENMQAANDIMEMGQYAVRTTRRTDSAELQGLISTLDGASDIQYKHNSFTAVLQPKDLKKLCHNSRLVRTIKEVKRINKTNSCNKLRKVDPKFVIPSSYIVMIKQHYDMTEMRPLNNIMIASNNLDSSVMITSVREFRNPNRRGAAMRMNSDALEFMCNQSVVDYIEEDQEITIASSTSSWHLDRIDQRNLPLDGQYTSPNDGSGVDIYVFDTGINYDHEEFEGRAKYDLFDPVDAFSNSNQQGRDCDGHGTHVAALVAGKTYGVAKGATVYSMRVFRCGALGISGSIAYILFGINHVIEEQMNNRTRRIIINMSLRADSLSQSVDDAIRDATEQGILVVTAAGNDFQDACMYSPGASSYALTVGGTERRDDLYLGFFYSTNFGRCVDIFAPGQDIESAGIRSNDDVATRSGTSQATPIVSGAAAVYWNMNRTATPLEIKDTIISTCTRDKLRINGVVPSSFQDQTPNCLLFIDNQVATTHIDMDNLPYQIIHSVPSSMVETYIKTQEINSYALTYIDSYSINSVTQYNLIFKYMADIDFITIMSPRLRQIRKSVDSYEADGYQLTLIYTMMNANDHIAVLKKTNLAYSHEYRLTKQKHDSLYQTKSSQGESLLSTTVALTVKNSFRYTSIYVHDNIEVHHLSSVSVSELPAALDEQLSQGFYLTHLTTIPINPPSYSAVFHKMTKPAASYIMSKDLELDRVNEFVRMQVSEGFTPLVIAGLDTPNGLKFVVSFEQ